MIKILHVIGKRPTGGIGTVVKNYQNNMDHSKIMFDYLIFNDEPEGDFDRYVTNLGSTVYVLPELRNSRLFLIERRVKEFFKQYGSQYKIVHLHSPNIGFIVFKYAKKCGIKVRIIHSHATEYSDKILNTFRNYFLYKYSMRDATDYFYCSREAGKFLFGNRTQHLFEMYNAIDSEKFAYSKMARDGLRKELNISTDTLVLINTGRFNKQKNHDFLLKVANGLRSEKVDFVLLLVGDGELREKIAKKISYYQLEGMVRMLGYRNDIPALLSASDCFLLPSLYEGLPLSIVEAECNGLPSIISDTVTTEIDFKESFCDFCSINEESSVYDWVKLILKISETPSLNREKAYLLANKNHYSIKEEAKRVTEKYISLINFAQ